MIASNLDAGGGVQVASSLIDELGIMFSAGDRSVDIDFVVSSAVHGNLGSKMQERVHLDDHGPAVRPRRIRPTAGHYDVAFVVFGPLYHRISAHRLLLGYADVTSLYPDFNQPGIRGRVRRTISLHQARNADRLVVETGAIKDAVVARTGRDRDTIDVVANAVNGQVLERSAALSPLLPTALSTVIRLGYPARNYPHKNVDFLGALGEELTILGVPVEFVLTMRPLEWTNLSDRTRAHSINVGELGVSRVGDLIRECDGVIFPSLLEAASATPLEALALGSPLFASDRDFVRSVAHGAATYFDPLDACSAARSIRDALANPALARLKSELGHQVTQDLPTARDRADRILAIMTLMLER